ncbi:RING-variant domain-containing protein [Hamiltosporidium magnivora]|uniref:RING-variant domain-containing protein n=1 Tax=Hamiltosporidium magnivora TaxID=148818 RepID=A0A4Q9LM72_9MICR|nr:RING-variant domain-containing protein [Hamiltosporidium magnivora]
MHSPQTCKICFLPSMQNKPLFHPCKCSGTQKYVHESCLIQWFATKSQTPISCEICQYKYRYKASAQYFPSSIFRFLILSVFWIFNIFLSSFTIKEIFLSSYTHILTSDSTFLYIFKQICSDKYKIDFKYLERNENTSEFVLNTLPGILITVISYLLFLFYHRISKCYTKYVLDRLYPPVLNTEYAMKKIRILQENKQGSCLEGAVSLCSNDNSITDIFNDIAFNESLYSKDGDFSGLNKIGAEDSDKFSGIFSETKNRNARDKIMVSRKEDEFKRNIFDSKILETDSNDISKHECLENEVIQDDKIFETAYIHPSPLKNKNEFKPQISNHEEIVFENNDEIESNTSEVSTNTRVNEKEFGFGVYPFISLIFNVSILLVFIFPILKINNILESFIRSISTRILLSIFISNSIIYFVLRFLYFKIFKEENSYKNILKISSLCVKVGIFYFLEKIFMPYVLFGVFGWFKNVGKKETFFVYNLVLGHFMASTTNRVLLICTNISESNFYGFLFKSLDDCVLTLSYVKGVGRILSFMFFNCILCGIFGFILRFYFVDNYLSLIGILILLRSKKKHFFYAVKYLYRFFVYAFGNKYNLKKKNGKFNLLFQISVAALCYLVCFSGFIFVGSKGGGIIFKKCEKITIFFEESFLKNKNHNFLNLNSQKTKISNIPVNTSDNTSVHTSDNTSDNQVKSQKNYRLNNSMTKECNNKDERSSNKKPILDQKITNEVLNNRYPDKEKNSLVFLFLGIYCFMWTISLIKLLIFYKGILHIIRKAYCFLSNVGTFICSYILLCLILCCLFDRIIMVSRVFVIWMIVYIFIYRFDFVKWWWMLAVFFDWYLFLSVFGILIILCLKKRDVKKILEYEE